MTEPEFEPKQGILPYNLNVSPDDMTPAEFAAFRQRNPGRLVLVYRDDRRTEVSQYHHPSCDDTRCIGCNGNGCWDYWTPDVEPDGPGTRLATTMARLQQSLIGNIRSGRVGWRPEDHPAILLAAQQAFEDAVAENKHIQPDELTEVDRGVAEYLARGLVGSILRQVRSYRSKK